MATLLVYAVLAIIVAGGLFVLAAHFLPAGEQIAPVLRDEPIWSIPADRALSAEEIGDVRLPVALRGYRFVETDLLLDRLGEELKARDAEIAQLRGLRPSPVTDPAAETAEVLEDLPEDEDEDEDTTGHQEPVGDQDTIGHEDPAVLEDQPQAEEAPQISER